MAAQTVHLVSCAYNSVMLGEIATMDWDMFHSKYVYVYLYICIYICIYIYIYIDP
jgi:hypothetical protein